MSDIDDVFAMLGFGRMQYFVLSACLLVQLWLTNEQLGFAVVVAGANCELELDDERISWLMATNFAAQMLTCLMWGELADRFGRRRIIMCAGLTSIMLSILSACMPEYWSFLVVRSLAGFFVSALVVALMTYLSEFTKVSLRPRVLNIMSYSLGLSIIYVATLAGVLLPLETDPVQGWRILLLCNQIPGLLGLGILLCLPESPKYFLSIGDQERALRVMERVCRMNKGKDATLNSLGVKSLTQPRLLNPSMTYGRCHDTKTLLVTYAKFMGIFSFIIFSLCGMILTSEVEERLSVCEHLDGYSPKRNPPKCRLSYEDMKDQLIQGFVVLGLFVVTSLLLICINRKVVILFYIGAATGGCLLLNFVTHPYVILASFLIVMDPPLCSIRLIATILIDLVPTRLRGKALALTSILSRCGVLVISLYMGYTLSRFCYVTFNLFILLFLVCGVLVHLLPSETKMKSLTQ
ncbi:putative transporter SVOPL isoform X2 [Drosophila ficusphila]|uniref:putative transporter SVOPL isoform X2 n=1 Tax=Drosophila ficusphila TaxID=30025 RepID=UPI001C89E48F|nr:putative transporter SVOPL isoform X2 [Drosophila ficusphila]